MADLYMDAATAPPDLSLAPLDVLTRILQTLSDKYRFTCALVCKAWAKAAAAATCNVKVCQSTVQKLNCLQQWLEKHGNTIKSLQLHGRGGAALTGLPCAQLQDLVLQGGFGTDSYINVSSRVWADITAATKITSVSLSGVKTASQQAEVVSALTALPDLEHLSWYDVRCSNEQQLSDSLLLQQLTQLTKLDVQHVSAAALEHLGSLTKLQNLMVNLNDEAATAWAAEGWPGLGGSRPSPALG